MSSGNISYKITSIVQKNVVTFNILFESLSFLLFRLIASMVANPLIRGEEENEMHEKNVKLQTSKKEESWEKLKCD